MIDLSTAGTVPTAAVDDRPRSVDELGHTISRLKRRRRGTTVGLAALIVAAVVVVATTLVRTPAATKVTSQPPATTLVPSGRRVPMANVDVAQVIDTIHLVGTYGSIVVMSADGGATWTEAGTPKIVASRGGYWVGFGDPQHGWACSTGPASDSPNVEVTGDGGRTWHLVPKLTNAIDIVASVGDGTVSALIDTTPGL